MMTYFYPRSPCGERLDVIERCIDLWTFLSTLSLRRATGGRIWNALNYCISIHALLAESDHSARTPNMPFGNFYPRSPCGERPASGTLSDTSDVISIHALLAESDFSGRVNNAYSYPISIHALLAESDGPPQGRFWLS